MRKKRWSAEKLNKRCADRLGQLHRLARVDYGDTLPDDDAGREHLREMVRVSAFPEQEIRDWAPWMSEAEVEELLSWRRGAKRWLPQNELGVDMNVNYAKRQHLKLWSMFPCDKTEEEMVELRQERRNEQQRLSRGRNRMRREDWLEQQRRKPKAWVVAGMTERTYYRRKAKAMADGKILSMPKTGPGRKLDHKPKPKVAVGVKRGQNGVAEVVKPPIRIYHASQTLPPPPPAAPQQGIQQTQAAALSRITDAEEGMV